MRKKWELPDKKLKNSLIYLKLKKGQGGCEFLDP
jgi:hypothetical protein